jgi:hypothetical protein
VRGGLLPIERPSAGYCERLLYYSLYSGLKSGRVTTNLNGRIVSEAEARRMVAYAWTRGFLPPTANPTVYLTPRNHAVTQMNAACDAGTDGSKIVVLHIPHSYLYVPNEERQAILLDDAALDRELLRMTDAYTDELFPMTALEAGRVLFPVSRLVCDVERFPSDEKERMAARGMGVFYTRTYMGNVLRLPLGSAVRRLLLDRWYRPHHATLHRFANGPLLDCRLSQLPVRRSAL